MAERIAQPIVNVAKFIEQSAVLRVSIDKIHLACIGAIPTRGIKRHCGMRNTPCVMRRRTRMHSASLHDWGPGIKLDVLMIILEQKS